jgi:hypothetical protein
VVWYRARLNLRYANHHAQMHGHPSIHRTLDTTTSRTSQPSTRQSFSHLLRCSNLLPQRQRSVMCSHCNSSVRFSSFRAHYPLTPCWVWANQRRLLHSCVQRREDRLGHYWPPTLDKKPGGSTVKIGLMCHHVSVVRTDHGTSGEPCTRMLGVICFLL